MKAHQEMFEKTSTKECPWHVIETDNKDEARLRVLEIIVNECKKIEAWMEDHAQHMNLNDLKKALRDLR